MKQMNWKKWKNLLKNRRLPKAWIACIFTASVLAIGGTVIAGAGYLQTGFDPGNYTTDSGDNNDIDYNSTVFNADEDSLDENSKELDNEAEDDYNMEDGEDPLDGEDESPNEPLVITDGTGDGSDNTPGNAVQVSDGDGAKDIYVVIDGPGNGKNPDTGEGENKKPVPDGGGTGETPKADWRLTDITVTSRADASVITMYQYLVMDEDTIHARLKVMGTYEDANHIYESKTEEITEYDYEISGGYFNKTLEASDIGTNQFTITVTCGRSLRKTISCNVKQDYRMVQSVQITDYLTYYAYVGEPLDEKLKSEMTNKLQGTVTLYTASGRRRFEMSLKDYASERDVHVEFQGSSADKSVTSAGLSLKNDYNNEIVIPNLIPYKVYNYKLTVYDYEASELQVIYQDEPDFDLLASINGTPSAYQAMIAKLKSQGKYTVDKDGNLKQMFYGWSVKADNTDLNDVTTLYTFSGNVHEQSLYPYPLIQVADGFQIVQNGTEQILTGYSGTEGADASVLEIPYGVTTVRFDDSFKLQSSVGAKIQTIQLSATVNEIDFSNAAALFPNLQNYVVEKTNNRFQSMRYGSENQYSAIYTDNGTTLLRLPVQSPESYEVPYSKQNENNMEISVAQIADGALDDVLMTLNRKGQKLTLQMTSPKPPEFTMSDNRYSRANCNLLIQVMDSDGMEIPDYYLKYYTASWGTMLDEVFDSEGIALREILTTNTGRKEKYRNRGNLVYSETDGKKTLEFVPADTAAEYTVEPDMNIIQGYAFDQATDIQLLHIPASVIQLNENCFVMTGDSQLAAIDFAGNHTIDIKGKLFGTLGKERIVRENFHVFVSTEQEKTVKWTESLERVYTAEEVKRILVAEDGTVIRKNQCIYLKEDESGQLKLFYIPQDTITYEAPEELKTIEQNALTGCKRLETLILSQADSVIVKEDFAECTSLKVILAGESEVTAPEQVAVLRGDSYFEENGIIYEMKEKHYEAVSAVSTLEGIISLKEGTTVVSDEVFSNCKEITGIDSESIKALEVIGASAFEGCTKLQGSLELYASTIGERAFAGCAQLTNVSLCNGIETIGTNAFTECAGLIHVYWEADISSVGDAVFADCNNLLTITIGGLPSEKSTGVITTLGNRTFEACENVIALHIQGGIRQIGAYTFKGCSKMAVQIDQNENLEYVIKDLESIGEYAFEGCSALRNVYTAGASFGEIGVAAFTGCISLENVHNLENRSGLTKIHGYAFSSYTIGETEYNSCVKLAQAAFPQNLVEIGEYAFCEAVGLREADFDMARKLSVVGQGAFAGCSSLREANLNATQIRVLQNHTFNQCSSMISLVLPESLERLEADCISECTELRSIVMRNAGKTQIAEQALGSTGKNQQLTIYVPMTPNHTLMNSYLQDQDWKKELDTDLSEIFQELEDYLIMGGGMYEQNEDGTYTLVSVLSATSGEFTVNARTTKILPDAFKDCSEITMIVLPEKVTKLPDGIFSDCSKLEALIMDRVTDTAIAPPELQGSLFGTATPNVNFRVYVEDQRVEVMKEWTHLPVYGYGDDWFIDSSVLYSNTTDENGEQLVNLLYVPRSYQGELIVEASTDYVLDEAARGCTGLTDVSFNYALSEIGDRAFADCSALETIFMPNTNNTRLTRIGEEAFMNCVSLVGRMAGYQKRLAVPQSVKEIGTGAFRNCTSLTYFSMQGWLTEIPDEMFAGCTSLSTYTGSLTALATTQRIGKKAFYQCTSITSISWTNMTNLQEVDDSAYEGCSHLILATFADKLERIGDRCFMGTNLYSISFNGIEAPELGEQVMEEELQKKLSIFVPTGAGDDEVVEHYQSKWNGQYPKLAANIEGIPVKAFRMVSNILYAVNPENAKELTVIKVPEILTTASIYNAASLYCIGIGDGAFKGCSQIETLNITSNIKTIGNRAFDGCTSLTSITVASDTPYALGSQIFGDNIPENAQIMVPEKSLEIYQERWGDVLDRDYGEGTAAKVIKGYTEETN